MKTKLVIRWMTRKDLPQVLDIEGAVFPDPWSEEALISQTARRNCIAMVAVDDPGDATFGQEVRGYVVYMLDKKCLHILRMGVKPFWQRENVGTAIIEKLIGKLSDQRRTDLICRVHESRTEAHLFFRATGFRAARILREHFEDGAAAYEFRRGILVPETVSGEVRS